MYKSLHYILIVIVILISAGCKKKGDSLPRALTPEEIREYFPRSESMEMSVFEKSMIDQGLLDLQSLDEDIFVNLKYSSEDNFFGFDAYGTLELAYLQPEPARALTKANRILKRENSNLRLLVYDAARPLSVQKILWRRLDSLTIKERKNYVADPEIGSIHNYGCAVDLTIYDLETQRPLDMGTPYDFFGELAYPRLERQMLNEGKLSLRQLNNRILLRTVMEEAGFKSITSEWWHFNFYTRKIAESRYKIIQ
jgi:D-alanyl-D-alanine dipeptidase